MAIVVTADEVLKELHLGGSLEIAGGSKRGDKEGANVNDLPFLPVTGCFLFPVVRWSVEKWTVITVVEFVEQRGFIWSHCILTEATATEINEKKHEEYTMKE